MEKSRLLMKEQPLVVDKTLASLIGLNEAIVLQQIEYWTNIKEISDIKKLQTRNENFIDGYYWTYNTIEDWTSEFPFWSYDTVKRTLKKLRDKNLLVTGNYNLKGYDRTLWYRVNHAELINLEYTISAKCTNEVNRQFKDKKSTEPLKTDISAKCPNGLVQNAPMHQGKMPQPIPKITTKTSTEISTSSSSTEKNSNKINLLEEFESNICELKKTTLHKFTRVVEKNNIEMILAVIEECTSTGVKSYKGFEVAFNSYLERNCKTREDVIITAAKYRAAKKSKRTYAKKSNSLKVKVNDPKGFNNFEPREYDYDSLEKKLLGWDNDLD